MCVRSQYWGVGGAGMMFVCSADQTVLLLLRAAWVAQGGSWGIPGGGLSEGWQSTPMKPVRDMNRFWTKAVTEVEEECGSLPPGFKKSQVVDKTIYEDCGFRYVTFLADLTLEQKRGWQLESLDGETDEFLWVDVRKLSVGSMLKGRALHFGVEYTMENSKLWSRA